MWKSSLRHTVSRYILSITFTRHAFLHKRCFNALTSYMEKVQKLCSIYRGLQHGLTRYRVMQVSFDFFPAFHLSRLLPNFFIRHSINFKWYGLESIPFLSYWPLLVIKWAKSKFEDQKGLCNVHSECGYEQESSKFKIGGISPEISPALYSWKTVQWRQNAASVLNTVFKYLTKNSRNNNNISCYKM